MLTAADRTAAADRLNRYLPPLVRYQGVILDNKIGEIDHAVERFWESVDATRWLALGIDVLFDIGFAPPRGRPMTREALVEKFDNLVAEANQSDPSAWEPEAVAIGKAWLQVSPYTVWRMVEDARESAYDAVEGVLFEACGGDTREDRSVVQAICQSFRKSIADWEKVAKAIYRAQA
jgi:hypothetical protein